MEKRNQNEGKDYSHITASSYFIHLEIKEGMSLKVELTGLEKISTPCPDCRNEYTFDFDDFLEIMKEGSLYGTSIFCPNCSAKRATT